jgi:DHA2 family multidrug resistance protein-like MFS transporter
VGGAILMFAPWPWVFAAAVPLALISLLFGRALPRLPVSERRYDFLAAGMSAATFCLIVVGLQSGVDGAPPWIAALTLLTGAAMAVTFVRREMRSPRPILPVDLLGHPAMALTVISGLCASMGSTILPLYLPFLLQHDLGFDPAEVGAIVAPWPFAMMITMPIAGVLSDKYPAAILGAIGMVIATAALIFLAFTPSHPGYFDLAWRMGLCGVGFGIFTSPNSRMIIAAAPRDRTAAAGGMIVSTRLAGQTLGSTVAALLLSVGLGGGGKPALVAAIFTVAAGLCSIARLAPRAALHVRLNETKSKTTQGG